MLRAMFCFSFVEQQFILCDVSISTHAAHKRIWGSAVIFALVFPKVTFVLVHFRTHIALEHQFSLKLYHLNNFLHAPILDEPRSSINFYPLNDCFRGDTFGFAGNFCHHKSGKSTGYFPDFNFSSNPLDCFANCCFWKGEQWNTLNASLLKYHFFNS